MQLWTSLESAVRTNVCGNQTGTPRTTSVSIWLSTLPIAVHALSQDTTSYLSPPLPSLNHWR